MVHTTLGLESLSAVGALEQLSTMLGSEMDGPSILGLEESVTLIALIWREICKKGFKSGS